MKCLSQFSCSFQCRVLVTILRPQLPQCNESWELLTFTSTLTPNPGLAADVLDYLSLMAVTSLPLKPDSGRARRMQSICQLKYFQVNKCPLVLFCQLVLSSLISCSNNLLFYSSFENHYEVIHLH